MPLTRALIMPADPRRKDRQYHVRSPAMNPPVWAIPQGGTVRETSSPSPLLGLKENPDTRIRFSTTPCRNSPRKPERLLDYTSEGGMTRSGGGGRTMIRSFTKQQNTLPPKYIRSLVRAYRQGMRNSVGDVSDDRRGGQNIAKWWMQSPGTSLQVETG